MAGPEPSSPLSGKNLGCRPWLSALSPSISSFVSDRSLEREVPDVMAGVALGMLLQIILVRLFGREKRHRRNDLRHHLAPQLAGAGDALFGRARVAHLLL